jgi:tetratricopeptide (TPR) repeat protein
MIGNKAYLQRAVLFVLVLLSGLTVLGQKPTATPKPPDPNLVRWMIFLDGLEQQSRSVAEERKPYVVAEVASAYWEVDRAGAERLFVGAVDSALKLTEQDKKYGDVLDDVLTMASRLDVSLAKLLTKRIAEKQGSKKGRYDIAGSNLYELLKEDPQRAAELAEAFAPDGLPLAAPNFILSLAKADKALADRLYSVYLEKIAGQNEISVEHLVSMCGYAMGYPEYYTMDGTGGTSGMTALPVKGHTANPRFAAPILKYVYRRLIREIGERNNAVGADIEKRTWRILFAVEYLGSEIERFDPASASAWEEARQQVRAGVSAEQMQNVAMRVNSIVDVRNRVRAIADSPATIEDASEASLEGVEKIVGTCQRDLVYMKAALNFSYRKNFKRALELLGKIEGEGRAESVRQNIFYDMAIADIENAEWDAAEARIKKIPSPNLKVLAHIKLADALVKRNQSSDARNAADAAVAMIEKLDQPNDRAGMYIGLAAIYLKIDPIAARSELERAIKHFNKAGPKDDYSYSFLIKVPMSCDTKGDEWYGGSYSPDNSDILKAVKLFAKENPDAAKSTVESIGDVATRIRAEAVVARAAFGRLKKA